MMPIVYGKKVSAISIDLPRQEVGWRQAKRIGLEILEMANLAKKGGCPAVVVKRVK